MLYPATMPTIRTTMEPWREVDVTEPEYLALLRAGLVYDEDGPPPPPPPSFTDAQYDELDNPEGEAAARILLAVTETAIFEAAVVNVMAQVLALDYATVSALTAGLNAKSNLGHTHVLANITDAAAALAAKADLVGGVVPTSQMPPLAINETFVVASQAAMLALTAQRGDMAVRTDIGRTFVLATDSPSTLADWKEVTAAGQVTSVAGRVGVVALTSADLSDFATAVDARVPAAVPAATTSAAGKVRLATSAEVQAFGDATRAVTPDALGDSGILYGGAGTRFKVFAGTIRYVNATTWSALDDAAHTPTGIASVTYMSDRIRVTYDFTATEVVTVVATPDETIAAVAGIRIGSSVGLTYTDVYFYSSTGTTPINPNTLTNVNGNVWLFGMFVL